MDPEQWDRLLDAASSPFVEHRFLASLERAGVLGADNGWVPRFPVVKKDGVVVAAAPAYVKFHSMGEFVFDHSWASFAERAGLRYYPKLLVGVPFTPVTGARLLTHPDEDRDLLLGVLGGVLVEMCRAFELSSVHVNFARSDEIEALERGGFMVRHGIQYHWYRHDEEGFDAYLARFKSKRRNQIKREVRETEKQGVTIRTLTGDELTPDLAPTAYRIYRSTVDKLVWGRRYLEQVVFEEWFRTMKERVELVVAEKDERIIAGAVNFAKNGRLYGRYWGCFEELRHLHFNVCYYHGIQRAFERGYDVFEPGAGGEHKLVRCFEPTVMKSAHLIREPALHEAIGNYLESERVAVEREREMMLEELGLR
ncbi:MAG: GNAT family N-acetyltransferase [Deltaproteobacteria bacterium]